jgi:hypothetical protein
MTSNFLAVIINTRFWICWHVPRFNITASNRKVKQKRLHLLREPNQLPQCTVWTRYMRRWLVYFTLRSTYPQSWGQNFREVGTHTILHPWRREHKYANSINISSFVSVITGGAQRTAHNTKISVHTSPGGACLTCNVALYNISFSIKAQTNMSGITNTVSSPGTRA